MSCCPKAPPIRVGSGYPDEPTIGPSAQRQLGESEECFQARAGNASETGSVGDKTVPVPDRIVQNAIAPTATPTSCSVNLQFSVTGPRVPTSWAFVQQDGSTPAAFSGITLASTGLMTGTFASADYGRKLTVRVIASDGAGVIDDRTYDFSPALGTATNSLRLKHPLPGSVLTCRFGPRKPPTSGASSNHGGCDFASGRAQTRVLAAADGVVTLARPGTGYGNYVIIRHQNGSGLHLISTLYAHLSTILVAVGENVMAGQAIGIEGNTGVGTGPHLHFEARMPNDVRVDPLPYIDSTVTIAAAVTPENAPTGPTSTETPSGTITHEDIAARSDCPRYGATYPGSPTPDATVGAGPGTPADVLASPEYFDKAWYFTMRAEVSPLWMTTPDRSPGDPVIDEGRIDTPEHKRRVGFVDHPADPGGITKFGVAQRFNSGRSILELGYVDARQIGKAKYWSLGGPTGCAAYPGRVAVVIFDANFALGPGGAADVLCSSGVTPSSAVTNEDAAIDAITTARLAYYAARPADRVAQFGAGWRARTTACATFAKSLA